MVKYLGIKLSTHTYYITPMTLNLFPWQPPTTDTLRQLFLKSLLHFSNLPTIVHMEMKLCACVFHCYHNNRQQKSPQALFPITTSSLLILANHAMHGSETWYACAFECFHDNHKQKLPQALFPITTSSLLKLVNHTMHKGETW